METLGSHSRLVLSARGLEVRDTPERGRCLCAGEESLAPGALALSCPAYGALVSWDGRDFRCDYCLRAPEGEEEEWPRCSGCKRVRYCSKACQSAAWREYHARECRAAGWDAAHLDSGELSSASIDEVRLCSRMLWQRDIEKRSADTAGDGKSQVPRFEDFEALVSHTDRIRKTDKLRAEGTRRVARFVLDRYHAGIAPQTTSSNGKNKKPAKGKGKGKSVADDVKSLDEVESMLYRMQCNDFGVWDGLIVCVGAGVFPAGAMVNHSCDANCVVTYAFAEGQRPVQQFRCSRAVAPHEELTHCYLDLASTAASRRKDLSLQYMFTCDCPRCVPEPVEHDASLCATLPGANSRLLAAADDLYARGCDLSQPAEQCKEWLRQCYTIRSRMLHPRNLELMSAAAHLMTASLETGDWSLARTCGEHVLATYRYVYPSIHPMLGLHLYTLGDIASRVGDASAAHAYYDEALTILTLTHGKDAPLVTGLKQLVVKH